MTTRMDFRGKSVVNEIIWYNDGPKKHATKDHCFLKFITCGDKYTQAFCGHLYLYANVYRFGTKRPLRPCKTCMAELLLLYFDGDCDKVFDMLDGFVV